MDLPRRICKTWFTCLGRIMQDLRSCTSDTTAKLLVTLALVLTFQISGMWEKIWERNSCHQFVPKRSCISPLSCGYPICWNSMFRKIRRVLGFWRPAGAIKAAQLGLKTVCIDKSFGCMPWPMRGRVKRVVRRGDPRRGPPGGTCLNVSASITIASQHRERVSDEDEAQSFWQEHFLSI